MTVARLSISSLNRGPSKKRTVLAGNDPILSGAYESIATVTVGAGGASSVSFTSIPSTYKHLQIRAIGRQNNAANTGNPKIEFNGDTNSNNYALHILYGDGATAAAYGTGAPTVSDVMITAGANIAANIFSAAIIDILDYSNTNKNKTVRSLTGADFNGSGTIRLYSDLWMSTSAISSITLTPNSSASFVQYTHIALYGIR